MANLSNINGKFVVEQTTGYVGVGTTDPSYLLHMSSADTTNGTRLIIENTNASGKEYGLIADNTGVFSLRDLTAGADRLTIDSSGNSTFAGTVGIGGAPDQKLTLKDSGNLYMHIDRTSGAQVYLGATDAEGLLTTSNSFPLIIKTNNTPALTIDTSQNATFTENVTLSGLQKKIIFNTPYRYIQDARSGADYLTIAQNSFAAGIQLGFDDTIGGGFGATMTIIPSGQTNNAGNVGIGDTTPSFPLVISKSSSSTSNGADLSMRLGLNNPDQTNNNLALITFGDGTTQPGSGFMGMQFTDHTNNYGELVFGTRGAGGYGEKMRIDSSGRIGIGIIPETWTLFTPIQTGQASGFIGRTALNQTDVSTNWYYNGGQLRINTGFAQRYTQHNNGDHTWMSAPTGAADSTIAWTEHMRIQATGNVGIGTTSPGAKLHVLNTGNYESIRIGNSQAANVNKQGGITSLNYIGNSTSIFQYATNAGGNTVYYGSADGSFRGITQHSFMISSGVDTVSHSTKLKILPTLINAYLDLYLIKSTPTIILEGRNFGNSGAKLQFLGWANTHDNWELGNAMAGQGFQFRASATAGSTNFATVAVINSGTGVYTAISDINKKKDFEDSEIGLKEVMKLKPKLFRMKTENENSDKHLGFIAQEVKKVIPQAYLEENGENDEKFIGLQDRPIIAALTKAIQELKAEIEILKNK